MRSDPPPLLRSRTQAGVLTVLLLNPGLEFTQTELSGGWGYDVPEIIATPITGASARYPDEAAWAVWSSWSDSGAR